MAEEEALIEDLKPLTPDEFKDALQAVASLGLTWTADRVPRVTAKSTEGESAFVSSEYQELVSKYPNLPRELSVVVYHALTGAAPYYNVVGPPEDLAEKVAIVRSLLLTESYRSEFFFKHAIKVPYFETIDWEVVFKTHERNVAEMPAVGYALLLLIFHNTNENISRANIHQSITVAVDLPLVNRLIDILTDVRTALEDVKQLSGKLSNVEQLEEHTDARTN